MGEPFISYGAFLTCFRSDAPPNTALFPRSPQCPKSGPGSEPALTVVIALSASGCASPRGQLVLRKAVCGCRHACPVSGDGSQWKSDSKASHCLTLEKHSPGLHHKCKTMGRGRKLVGRTELTASRWRCLDVARSRPPRTQENIHDSVGLKHPSPPTIPDGEIGGWLSRIPAPSANSTFVELLLCTRHHFRCLPTCFV